MSAKDGMVSFQFVDFNIKKYYVKQKTYTYLNNTLFQ